jgi:N-acetyl-gamma-glutamyl-phosphate reductase
MLSVGIIGASGFTGAELLRLLAGHPDLDVQLAAADTQAGVAVGDLYPSLRGEYPTLAFSPTTDDVVAACGNLDLVFLGLPHGASQSLMPQMMGSDAVIIDLAADFRLADPADYLTWYGDPHTCADQLDGFVYGLPEITGDALDGARRIAAAGCYPTAAALALAPLVEAGIIDTTGIVVDAASGVSGAGRAAKEANTFAAVDANFTAYGLTTHRHTPEIEQSVARLAGASRNDVSVLFTPHLAPMSRGILATCYTRPTGDLPSTDQLVDLFSDRYAQHPFVTVTAGPPATKSTLGSNSAHVGVVSDPRTGWIISMAAIDNLVKGASGQAIQCANLALGLNEAAGLPIAGVYP